ncbi:MFS transporter [Maricaulis parjimensis]|uniref:MFS transporter n=1 Tax=Maricaulis parjimensis TaxID=144023 RepID=UPI00193A7FA7|nr:MFS transporter [Maricaulis parjimensis]
MPVFRPLAGNRNLRLPPFGAYLVLIAAWFFSFGLQTTLFPGVITFTLGESPERLGIAQAALTAPMMLLLPFAGVLAERTDRRGIIFYFYIFAGVAAAVLGGLLLADRLSYWIMVSFALMIGVAGGFVMPARDSAINPIVRISARTRHGGIDLQRAVVMASAVQFGAQIAGMALGYVAAFTGPGALFLVQGIGLLVGGFSAVFLPRLGSKRNMSTAHPLDDLRDGISAVIHSPVLMPMTAIMIVLGLLIVGGAFLVLIPLVIREAYGGGFQEIASLMVCFWIGAFIANVALAVFPQIEKPGRALILAQGVTVLATAAFALPLPFWSLYVLVFCWGLGAGVAISLSRSVVQEQAPPDKLARVMSVYQLGLFGGMPAGAILMGFMIGGLGPQWSALLPAIGLGVVLVVISLTTPILSVRRGQAHLAAPADKETGHAETDR